MFKLISRVFPERVTQGITAVYFKAGALWNVGFGTHSKSVSIAQSAMKVRIIPALSDNYMYLLMDPATKEAAIVDPVDPGAVMLAVNEEEVTLSAVLTTHHHWDHAGGNEHIVKLCKNLKVYGGDDRIGALSHKVGDGDKFKVGSLEVKCLHTPCHTSGHICYYVTSDAEGDHAPVVFTGDTLFIAGCGRFFEGTAEQMCSAFKKLSDLPDNTKVFCGHEYSVKNLEFSETVEPENSDVKKKLEWARDCRNNEIPTVPSTIGDEKLINPFMRVHVSSVLNHCNKTDAVEAMGVLRAQKDKF
ncbi:unnamed protein product [Notodromas monacha]|uniref:hydroxyacylglutathione hydrolase n=1 Tax=Notodromas monacha TaxID=399045 RepID=A0A7R9GCX7_9CRUS|nr:unnamed protein product [Notodromas monacha]CAG0916323.1 unnamed protein product [Notodromas monacha]